MNIVGKNITLRALEFEDLEALRESTNDPSIEAMVVGWQFPVSKTTQKRWFESIDGNRTNHRFAIENKGVFCGISTLLNIDWKNRSASHGIKLIADAPKGIGLGFEAVSLTMYYAFEELQLNRLTGGMFTINTPSIKLYEKCGWVREGLLRQVAFKGNRYLDEYAVAILREEYFEWKNKMILANKLPFKH